MKKSIFILMAAQSVLAQALAVGPSTKWGTDNSHSSVNFSVIHLMVSEVNGQFNDFTGTILSDKEDFSDAAIDFSIQTKSINTGSEKRDSHLRSADFFDAEKYPAIIFTGKSLSKTGDKTFKISGEMTMHGVTKTVEFAVRYNGTIKDGYGNIKAGFKITGKINRSDFGLKWNMAVEAGGVAVSDEVEITCNLELVKQK